MNARVSIQTADFDLSTEVARLREQDKGVGAVCSFIGTVRDRNDGSAVSAMELEHYPGMTEKALDGIAREARERWDVIDIAMVHRIGPMRPTDQIVPADTTVHDGCEVAFFPPVTGG